MPNPRPLSSLPYSTMSIPNIDDILQALKDNAEQRDKRIAALENTLGNAKATLADDSIEPAPLAQDDRLATIEEALAALLENRTQPATAHVSGSTWASVLFRLFWLALILLALWACIGKVIRDEGRETSKPAVPPVTLQEKSLIDGAVDVVTADITAGSVDNVPDARLGLLASLPPSMPARVPFVTAVDTAQGKQPKPQDVGLYPHSMGNVVKTLVIDNTAKKKIVPPPLPPADKQPMEPLPLPSPPSPLPPAILPEPPRLTQERQQTADGKQQQKANRMITLRQRLRNLRNL